MPEFDPKDRVAVTRVSKRGEWHTVEGIVQGRKVTAHIPSPTLDGQKTRTAAEALMRRTLYGTSQLRSSDGGPSDRGEKP
jgi:hypothetical protein